MNKVFTNILRVFKYGALQFTRNAFVSLAAVLVMVIALFMITVSVFADAALKSVLNNLKEQVDVNVYFLPDAPEDKIAELKGDIESRDDISKVILKSKEQVLEEFKERHKNDKLTMQSLEELGDNPFGATLSVKAKSPELYDELVKYIESGKYKEYIDKINYSDSKRAIETLSHLIKTAQKIGFFSTAFLIAVAILIVFNTIRLAVYMSKDEIAVMKLVGASDWYAQGPFVVSGLLYALVSATLTFAIVYPLAVWLSEPSLKFLGSFDTYAYLKDNILSIVFMIYAVAIILGIFASYMSVRRYLDV